MYTLQRDNVVKITDSTEKRDSYIAAGFREISAPAVNPEKPKAKVKADGKHDN